MLRSNVIAKTFHLLRAFTDHQNEWGVNELSRFLDMPPSSVHRMITMLRDENILSFSETTEKYKVGDDFIRMASIISANVDIKKIARPYLMQVADTTGHSVYLAHHYPEHHKLAFIERVRSSYALQYVLDIGVLQPIHVAASGKCILAFLEEEVIHQIVNENISDDEKRKEIFQELETIRENHYAITSNERKQGALSVGSTIFDASKKVIGSIICVLPISDFKIKNKQMYIDHITKAAKEISYSLGYLE